MRAATGRVAALVLTSLIVTMMVDPPLAAASGPIGASRSDTSPVNLATPVDMADGMAHQSAIVRSGDARIEVLSSTLFRLEYSPSGRFEDSPTVNAINRRMPVPAFRTGVSGGWLTVATDKASLRYKVGSGPFTPANTTLRFMIGNQVSTVHPTWDWECPFGQTCQAGAATLSGGASLSQTQPGYQSIAGYVGYLEQGATATWSVIGAPAGRAQISVRYSNIWGAPLPSKSMISLVVDNHVRATLVAAPTDDTSPWSTLNTTILLRSGTNSVSVVGASNSNDGLGIDSVSIGPANAPAPVPLLTDPLGGWIRGFDTFTYGTETTCTAAQGANCQAAVEPLHTDGLLTGAGWRLLDDTESAIWTAKGWVQPRKSDGDLEDGYLFAYGHDYTGALRTLAQLTGSAPLLPRNIFGVWYSDYTPYSSTTVEKSIYPAFEQHQVPLDTLSLDTDWKAPNDWNGWEWNRSLFPDPSSFLQWARSHGIDVTLNIHSSIADNDPKLPLAQRIAAPRLPPHRCPLAPMDPARCGTGARYLRPSRTSHSNRAFRSREWRSGGWIGAATTRSWPCPGLPPIPGSAISTLRRWSTRVNGGSSWPASAPRTAIRWRCMRQVRGPTTPLPSPSPVMPGELGTRWRRRWR